MKKITLSALLLIVILSLALTSCGAPREELWEEATYTADRTLGEGETTFYLEVTAGETSVTFTVLTDEENLGEALKTVGLVEGDEGPYGLYIKRVNGILADYDINGAWWGFTVDGKSSPVGIDGVITEDGAVYGLTYSH